MAVAKTIYIDDDLYRVLENLKGDDISFNAFVNKILLSYVISNFKYLSDEDIVRIITEFIRNYNNEFRDFITTYTKT